VEWQDISELDLRVVMLIVTCAELCCGSPATGGRIAKKRSRREREATVTMHEAEQDIPEAQGGEQQAEGVDDLAHGQLGEDMGGTTDGAGSAGLARELTAVTSAAAADTSAAAAVTGATAAVTELLHVGKPALLGAAAVSFVFAVATAVTPVVCSGQPHSQTAREG
jgi:hypothetical protein